MYLNRDGRGGKLRCGETLENFWIIWIETGMLFRVKKEVNPRFEVAAGIRKISDTNVRLFFENLKTTRGGELRVELWNKKLLGLALGKSR